MKVVLKSDPRCLLFGRLTTILGAEFDVAPASVHEGPTSVDASAGCVVLVDAHGDGDAAAYLDRLRAERPLLPALLVAPRAREREARASAQAADGLVWLESADTHLRDGVHRTRAARVRRRVRIATRLRTSMPSLKQRALLELARGASPYRTVAELCAPLACNRATLWRAWHADLGTEKTRLQDVIDWFLLVEAVSRKHSAATWLDVADSLTVHQHTLSRMVRRIADCTLAEVTVCPDLVLGDASVTRMLARFVDPQAELHTAPAGAATRGAPSPLAVA